MCANIFCGVVCGLGLLELLYCRERHCAARTHPGTVYSSCCEGTCRAATNAPVSFRHCFWASAARINAPLQGRIFHQAVCPVCLYNAVCGGQMPTHRMSGRDIMPTPTNYRLTDRRTTDIRAMKLLIKTNRQTGLPRVSNAAGAAGGGKTMWCLAICLYG